MAFFNRTLSFKTKGIFLTTLSITGLTSLCYYKMDDQKKINLILDLDETLVHTKLQKLMNQNFDSFKKYSTEIDTENNHYKVWKRPYTDFMFFVLKPFCNFYMYTSATQDYADKIIANMDWDKHFKNKMYKDDEYTQMKCKPMNKVILDEDKELRTILVDDRNFNHCLTCNSKFIHIKPYSLYNNYDKEMLIFPLKIIWRYYF